MEQRIKERLIGAVALVAVVVIIVPALLTGPRQSSAPPPSVEAQALRTVTIDLAAGERGPIVRPPPAPPLQPVAEPNEVDVPLDGPTSPPAAPPVAAVAAAPTALAPSAKAPVPTPVAVGTPKQGASVTPKPVARAAAGTSPTALPKATPAAPATGHWAVQVGSFASRDRAKALASVLKAKGYKPLLTEIHGPNGALIYRVRLAAEKDRAHATTTAARLTKDGHLATVVPQS